MKKKRLSLNSKQVRAVELLLSGCEFTEAANQLGVTRLTLYRWRQLPAFQEAERAGRREILDRTVSQLLAIRSQAVATLKRALDSGEASVEVRSALAILEQGTKSVETLDLLHEIENLKKLIAEPRHHGNGRHPRAGQTANGNRTAEPDGAGPTGQTSGGPSSDIPRNRDATGPLAGEFAAFEFEADPLVVQPPIGQVDRGGSPGFAGGTP
jgi:hypothetical protein